MQSYNFGFLGKTDFLCVFSKISLKLITFAPLYPIQVSIFSANNSDNVSALTFILLLVSPSQPPPPSGVTSASPPSSTSLGQARLTFLTPSRTWKTCLVLCYSMTRRLTLISAAPGVLRLDKFSLHQEGDSPSLQEIFPCLMLCKASVSYRP